MSVVGPYTSTFGSAGFRLTNNQLALPRPGKTARYKKDQVPYGNLTTIQIGGVDTDDLTIDVILVSADYAGLNALVQTVNTLTLLGDSARTALFAKLSTPKFYLEGEVIAQATFVFA